MNKQNLKRYSELVQKANQQFNLTGHKTQALIYEHLVNEIVGLFSDYEQYFNNKTVVDLGSGNGCPGIVLKLLFPQIKSLCLVDSTNKKVNFLKSLIEEFQLQNTTAVWERIENHKQKYDVICSRGLGSVIEVNKLAINLLKPKGIVFHIKQSLDQFIEFDDSEQKELFNLLFVKFFYSTRQQALIALQKND